MVFCSRIIGKSISAPSSQIAEPIFVPKPKQKTKKVERKMSDVNGRDKSVKSVTSSASSVASTISVLTLNDDNDDDDDEINDVGNVDEEEEVRVLQLSTELVLPSWVMKFVYNKKHL
jgi:hypothetical protein